MPMTAVDRAIVVGPGRAGLALGYALVQREAVRELVVCGRRPEPPAHPLFVQGLARYVFGIETPEPGVGAVFVAVPDDALPEMAHTLAGHGDAPSGCAAFHLSGALSTDVMAPLHARGYAVGSFHVLQSLAHPVTAAERIPGSHVAVTGSPQALAVARRLTAALGCPILTVPESWRPLYHAAAVVAANYLPILLDAAARLLEQAGVSHGDALPALLPLVQGTLDNVAELGVERALTGPVVRGDIDTVELHLRALPREDRTLYALLGRELTRLAGEELDPDIRRSLRERFEEELV
jgi:predicted short-subunit dehydrogenase-like oxidoreductase (DUF2520 family)